MGRFKFLYVTLVEGVCEGEGGEEEGARSVSELLARLGLSCLTSLLELNGWDQLDRLEGLTRRDLEYLGVTGAHEQDRLLTAVARLGLGEEDGLARRGSLCSSSPSSSTLARSDKACSPSSTLARIDRAPSSTLARGDRASSHLSLSSLSLGEDFCLPSPPTELPSCLPSLHRSLRPIDLTDSFLDSAENLAAQLRDGQRMEEQNQGERELVGSEEQNQGERELAIIEEQNQGQREHEVIEGKLATLELGKTKKKLNSSLTISVISSELNKSF